MAEIVLGFSFFTAIVLALAIVILVAKHYLVAQGEVMIRINDGKMNLTTSPGSKLLTALSEHQLFVSSACGGGGTCGQCKVKVLAGGGSILSTERTYITPRQARAGERLSCQLAVKQDIDIELAPEVFGTHQWECTVISNDNVATFIKNLVLKLPSGEDVGFRAGGYIQIECPPQTIRFSDFNVGQEYSDVWDAQGLWNLESKSIVPISRAYSMASYPEEKEIIMLNVRIATPPSPELPPGVMSSYLFSLKPGDKVNISDPFGDFFAKETDNEMIFVGGGAGMAPMRSHIFDQLLRLRSKRKISFWYGARSRRELFFVEDFDNLAKTHDNFVWHIALSNPQPEDNWHGDSGFIHEVLYDNYLRDHRNPEDCEYYICGPPMMNAATINMLEQLGIEEENILFDDFGG